MPSQEEYELASTSLPPIAERLRKQIGTEAFGVLLGLITGDRPTIQIVRYLRKFYGVDIHQWHIVLWRSVLTAPSRKLMPGLSALVRQPLTAIPMNHLKQKKGTDQ